MNQNLNNLADFLEKLPIEEFDQGSVEKCVVGIGNRVNDDFTELRPIEWYKDNNYTGTEGFAQRYNVEEEDANNINYTWYSELGIGMVDVGGARWNDHEWMRTQAVEMLRRLANR